ncbi:MAG: HEAT repeat domain-containing protein [Candidatus Poribacteria bacterium]|nr:HEAT repeat domain-containing protein [Candidatus Poribacteria bacterium]
MTRENKQTLVSVWIIAMISVAAIKADVSSVQTLSVEEIAAAFAEIERATTYDEMRDSMSTLLFGFSNIAYKGDDAAIRQYLAGATQLTFHVTPAGRYPPSRFFAADLFRSVARHTEVLSDEIEDDAFETLLDWMKREPYGKLRAKIPDIIADFAQPGVVEMLKYWVTDTDGWVARGALNGLGSLGSHGKHLEGITPWLIEYLENRLKMTKPGTDMLVFDAMRAMSNVDDCRALPELERLVGGSPVYRPTYVGVLKRIALRNRYPSREEPLPEDELDDGGGIGEPSRHHEIGTRSCRDDVGRHAERPRPPREAARAASAGRNRST